MAKMGGPNGFRTRGLYAHTNTTDNGEAGGSSSIRANGLSLSGPPLKKDPGSISGAYGMALRCGSRPITLHPLVQSTASRLRLMISC